MNGDRLRRLLVARTRADEAGVGLEPNLAAFLRRAERRVHRLVPSHAPTRPD
jgi:hypothetical protein